MLFQHEIVPSELVERIASLKYDFNSDIVKKYFFPLLLVNVTSYYGVCRHGGTYKVLKNLLKYKLLHHDSSKCE